MAERYLIDTSAVIKYLNQAVKAVDFRDSILSSESNISVITEIELQAWNPPDKNDLLVYVRFIDGSNIFDIEKEVVNKTIEIKRNYRLKLGMQLLQLLH